MEIIIGIILVLFVLSSLSGKKKPKKQYKYRSNPQYTKKEEKSNPIHGLIMILFVGALIWTVASEENTKKVANGIGSVVSGAVSEYNKNYKDQVEQKVLEINTKINEHIENTKIEQELTEHEQNQKEVK